MNFYKIAYHSDFKPYAMIIEAEDARHAELLFLALVDKQYSITIDSITGLNKTKAKNILIFNKIFVIIFIESERKKN